MTKLNNEIRELTIDEMDAVSGAGVEQRGYGPARINISPFADHALLDPTWEVVGATGHL